MKKLLSLITAMVLTFSLGSVPVLATEASHTASAEIEFTFTKELSQNNQA